MSTPCRRTVLTWVTALIFLLVIASATFVGAKDSTKDSEGDKAGTKHQESLLRRMLEQNRIVLEQNRAILKANRALRAENALFRASQSDLLGQLDEMKGILKSFDERLSAFAGLDKTKRSKWSLGNGLPDAFRPAVAKP